MPGHSLLSAVSATVLDAARAIGLPADAIREEAGIDAAWLADPDGRIPLECEIRLWQVLSRWPCGLEIGARLGAAGMGVVGYALQHGATVGEALAFLERYRRLVHPELIAEVELEGGEAVFAHPVPPPFLVLREPVLTWAAAAVAMMRALTGASTRPARVALPLAAPSDPTSVERWFECPVRWAAPRIEVAFDAALLERTLPRADPLLFGYLARRADALLAQLPEEARWAERTRREIGAHLPDGEPAMASVARRLGVSERTLHRRLREEGTRFAALVDEARRARAQVLLGDPRMSASEVAFLLGYSEPAPFFRACRRWFGAPPQALRRRERDLVASGDADPRLPAAIPARDGPPGE